MGQEGRRRPGALPKVQVAILECRARQSSAWQARKEEGKEDDEMKKLAPCLLGALLLAIANPQPPPRVLKKFEPPDGLVYTLTPVIATSESCARDYAKALSLSGLEQKKMMADLAAFHCIETLSFIYRGFIMDTRTFDFGGEHYQMARVNLVVDTEMLSLAGLTLYGGISTEEAAKEGWVIRRLLVNRTTIQVLAKEAADREKAKKGAK